MKSETAYAALFVRGKEVGARIRCHYLMSGDKVRLTNVITFEPAPFGGMAEARFFKTEQGGDWDFKIPADTALSPGDTFQVPASK